MATVTNPRTGAYAVKNLGWLLKHFSASPVERVDVSNYTSLHGQHQYLLEVYFLDGFKFQEVFRNYIVLKDWVSKRRALANASLNWFGELALPGWQQRFKHEVKSFWENVRLR